MCTRSAGAQGLPGGRKHTERNGAVENAGYVQTSMKQAAATRRGSYVR